MKSTFAFKPFVAHWSAAGTLALGLGLLAMPAARAEFIPLQEADWMAPGDGALTRDRNTGLEWLFAGKDVSYDDVVVQMGPGGRFEGFRYATVNEVLELWSDAGIRLIGADFNAIDAAPAYALQKLMAFTDQSPAHAWTDGRTGTQGPQEASRLVLSVRSRICGDHRDACQSSAMLNGFVPDAAHAGIGHWLVRPSAALPVVAFDDFDIALAAVELGPLPTGSDTGRLVGTFKPGAAGNGIDLARDDVAVTIASTTVRVPGGRLLQAGAKFSFTGNVDGSDVALQVKNVLGAFEFSATLGGLSLSTLGNPVIVGVRVGDDAGEATVQLQGKLKFSADD